MFYSPWCHKESDTTEQLSTAQQMTLPIPDSHIFFIPWYLSFVWTLFFFFFSYLLFSTNAAVATGLEKVTFHSNPKERQCQRMLKLQHNCTHLTH